MMNLTVTDEMMMTLHLRECEPESDESIDGNDLAQLKATDIFHYKIQCDA